MSLPTAYEGLPWTATTTIQCSVSGKLLSVKIATDSIFAAASPILHYVAPTMRISSKAQPRKFPSTSQSHAITDNMPSQKAGGAWAAALPSAW